MIEKSHILSEIKRTAGENSGKPLGKERFLRETGIRQHDWLGRYWVKWSDALIEAGFSPNSMVAAYTDEHLLDSFAALIKELGRFPVNADLRMKARRDSQFPSHSAFGRFGRKHELAARVAEHCQGRDGYGDVIEICLPLCKEDKKEDAAGTTSAVDFGFVYLMKSGRYYKIGMSNSVGRREYELSIQLPEKPKLIHQITTDDPPGIEKYWHERFKKSAKGGEWFELTAQQVSDFKRRKFM